jgi:anthranilate phosphoribosyltransferase
MNASEKIRRQDGFAGKGADFYEALLAAHEGLDEKQSAALNARLVLLLANHVGSVPVLREALALARAGVRSGEQGSAAGIGTASKNQNKQT